MNTRTLALVSALAVAMPVAANAQRGGGQPQRGGPPQQQQPRGDNRSIQSPAYRAGVERGTRNGEDDGRQNRRFDYASKSDYRNGNYGYNSNYGDRTRWQLEFRLGFESGYRDGFGRFGVGVGVYGGNGNNGYGNYNNRPGYNRAPGWVNGRGNWQRTDIAFQNGFTDGYAEGLKDAQRRDRFDPTDEGRFRTADHGYNRFYGQRSAYQFRYRDAFREGYEYGFQDGNQYGRNYNGRPSWWPW